ncbi:hypothetical protein K9L16_00610 [Candidatus Pacearchaeota archaeon]|nr:hypothetical protein [Candidatus Pacearchaeota archaeon]
MGLYIKSGPSWEDDTLKEINTSEKDGRDLRRNRLCKLSEKRNRNYFPNTDTLRRGLEEDYQ